MKASIAIIVLIFVALLLGVALLHTQSKAKNEKNQDTVRIVRLSNDLVQAEGKLDEQRKVNEQLVNNLAAKIDEVNAFSNKLSITSNQLQQTVSDAKAAAMAAAEEIAKRDQKITQLETERDDLDKKMIGLNANLSSLTSKMSETERKLAASEGDREFLLKELRRLQTEKADLERRFNDLVVLRAQVNKLKDELTAAKRLDWFRRGLYGDTPKGATLLMDKRPVMTGSGRMPGSAPATNAPTNVEIRSGGGSRIVNPPAGATNAAPASPAPAPAKPASPQ